MPAITNNTDGSAQNPKNGKNTSQQNSGQNMTSDSQSLASQEKAPMTKEQKLSFLKSLRLQRTEKISEMEDRMSPWALYKLATNCDYESIDFLELDEDGLYDAFESANEIALEGFFFTYFVALGLSADINRAYVRLLNGAECRSSKKSLESTLKAVSDFTALCLYYSSETKNESFAFGINHIDLYEKDSKDFNDLIDIINNKLYVELGLAK